MNIDKTIEKIQSAETTALMLNPKGFYLNFSGGKDSIVLYDLVKRSGVKYIANMQLTTVDPLEVLQFVKKYYPDVNLHRPELSMFQLIKKKRCLPQRQMRFCCEKLKEFAGIGFMNLIGIRKAESVKRNKRNEIEISGHKYSDTLDQFNIDKEVTMKCIKGNDKLLFSPILNWSNADVWNYIRNNNLKYPDLYNRGYHRIGCVFCPMASVKEKQRERRDFPKFEYAYKKAIKYCIDNYGYFNDHTTNENEVFEWWISNQNANKYFATKKLQYTIDL